MMFRLSPLLVFWAFFGLACIAAVPASRGDDSTKSKENKEEKSPPWDTADRYETREIEGWRVLVNRRLLMKKTLSDEVLRLLDFQLYQIARQVPPGALKKLRTITIWVERAEPHHPCMAYHPAAEWLREHDMNPAKAGCVEIANGENFLQWTKQQPWMVLHELAHGYHYLFLEGGCDNRQIAAAYRRMMDAKSYESVLHIGGGRERAYATTNPMEYFAESSEAYFGTNDFYPFVRAELKEHDPEMFKLLEELWGAR